MEIQMFEIQNRPELSSSGQRALGLEHWDFCHWKFVSDFDIRISDFLTAFMPRRFACPARGRQSLASRYCVPLREDWV